ncbi:MAG: hypothetical protein NTW21_24020 [Verrucomicrobia bacterium]|nr:hypothetical protein [Verrucomicrobiota bacterium]
MPELHAQLWPQANLLTWVFPGNDLTAEGKELTVEWFDGVDPDFSGEANSLLRRAYRAGWKIAGLDEWQILREMPAREVSANCHD